MNFYKNYIAQAMTSEASGDEQEALAFYQEALHEAKAVDPCGPRVQEARAYLQAFFHKYPHMAAGAAEETA